METREKQLCIIGKGWQVRAALRQLAKHPLTLDEWLRRRNSSLHP
ncbi:Z-ring formation inhibitor MciZ [Salinithrix halophila]|uniref:Z-ring formation inhibitor MciZ n=1 Tax=Salinithrix halophila TaxID=1485204 RepID=A0ABV8JMH7_9BACL